MAPPGVRRRAGRKIVFFLHKPATPGSGESRTVKRGSARGWGVGGVVCADAGDGRELGSFGNLAQLAQGGRGGFVWPRLVGARVGTVWRARGGEVGRSARDYFSKWEM